MDEKFNIKREYWPGSELLNEAKGRSVIQSPNLPLFIQQCAKKLNWDTFNDKGLGLALYWYIDTFVSIKSEVNFLTLCTVLEILNRRNKRKQRCMRDSQNYDNLILKQHITNNGCKAPYRRTRMKIPVCSTPDQMKQSMLEVTNVKRKYYSAV